MVEDTLAEAILSGTVSGPLRLVSDGEEVKVEPVKETDRVEQVNIASG